jgi:hypothetical protein
MQDQELREICALPITYRGSEVGWHDVVRRSSYEKNREALTEGRVSGFLRANPELIDLWLGWSNDKRCGPGLFLRQSELGYELGRTEHSGHCLQSELFDEPSLPCARFILHELAI